MTSSATGRSRTIVTWAAQLLAAGILGMASVMKLTGNPDSVALFALLGAEPWGRWAVGLAELSAVGLLLRPKTAVAGGTIGIVLMLGAIGAHLTRLGIAYNGDPSLFVMALLVLAASVTVVVLRRPARGCASPR
jgi:hypothetical protein